MLQACEPVLPVRDSSCEVQPASNQFLQPPSHVTDGLAPTAVAERVSDDEEEDTKKLEAVHRLLAKAARDGYCQCEGRAVPASRQPGETIDRRHTNLTRNFRAIQRSVTTSKMVPRPLRSASVDRHGDGWSGTSSVKCQPINGGPLVCTRYNGSSAYRVSTPTDLAVLGGQTKTSRRHRATPPPRDGVGREINFVTDSVVSARQVTGGSAPHAAMDSDLASDVSDLDQDIVDDLHLAESVSSFTRRACRSSDTLRTTASTDSNDSQPHHQNGWIQADSVPVILRRSSAQDQIRSGSVLGTPRSQRAGSYHGSVHHSITLSDFPSLMSNNLRTGVTNRSPVGSLKSALANFAGRWSKSGRRCSASRNDVSEVEDGEAGCVADHAAGFMSRIVARASCRLGKNRSKSGERCGGSRSVAVCGGRVTVSAISLRHDEVKSCDKTTTTIYSEGPVSRPCDQSVDTDQQHVPYIDDSESESVMGN